MRSLLMALAVVACTGDGTDETGWDETDDSGTAAPASLGETTTGDPGLASIQNLDFAPDGTLAIVDGYNNQLVAGELPAGEAAAPMPEIDNVYQLAADHFGLPSRYDVWVQDIAVDPRTERVYVSARDLVNGVPALFTVSDAGALEPVDLSDVTHAAVAYSEVGGAGSIAYGGEWAGHYLVASVSEETLAPSQVITIEVPVDHGATPAESTTNIYHRSHNRWENYAPMVSLAAYQEDGEARLAASYTCTPAVRFEPGDLWSGDIDTEGTTPFDFGGGKQVMDMVVTSEAAYATIHGFLPLGQADPWDEFGAVRVGRDLVGEDTDVNADSAIVMGGDGSTSHPSASRAEELDGVYRLALVDDDTIVALKKAGMVLVEAP